uniref:Uncharacterized protein n=1 Tax=Lactuca sativa TaxID=4236 RepID=A0A9R1XBT3_LACSA|nr:hypothetical protein LSAT_V11C500287920 [Lactuca sativa]
MNDSLMSEILILQTTTFVMSDPRNFKFVGSIPDVMLEKVPLDNAIIKDYRKLPSFGARPIPGELQKIIDEERRKRKAKAATSENIKLPKKAKKPVQKPRSPSPVIQEESKERTITENPFLNLTTSPPSPPFTPPTSQMTSSPIISKIPITSIPPIPTTNSVGISLPQISIPLSLPIFTNSTPHTTSTVSTPPEVPSFKSVSDEIRTSDIPNNTFDVGPNANIGVTSEQPSSSVPPVDDDNEILFGDDQEPIVEFFFPPLSVNLSGDDDDAPMTKG